MIFLINGNTHLKLIVIGLILSAQLVAKADFVYGDFKYNVTFANTGFVANITGYIGNESNVTIPDSINGSPVTSITGFSSSSMTNVLIPISVTSIGNFAFDGCSSLLNVYLPQNLVTIGDYTFSSCTSLTNVSLAKNVASIRVPAFADCPNLASITVDQQNTNYSSREGILYDKNQDSLIIYPNGAAVNYTIPDGVIQIADSAFYHSTNLSSIIFCHSLRAIGGNAFSGCSSLTNVDISNGVTNLEGGAFSYCTSLTNLMLPDSIDMLGIGLISGCSGLTSISIPPSQLPLTGLDSINSRPFRLANQ